MSEPYDDLWRTDQDEQPEEPSLLTPDDAPSSAVIEDAPRANRGGRTDPAFGLLLALAVSIGLAPLLPANADLRYSLAWGTLAVIGVLAWLLGNAPRIEQEQPENLLWGVGFGLLVGTPFLLFGNDILGRAVPVLFPGLSAGAILAYLIFVMPLAETLFFRSLMQQTLNWVAVGALSSAWSAVLIFPVIWSELLTAPAVGVVFAITLLTVNLLYSYVRDRNGLAAAWLCQIVINLLLLFVPAL